MGKGVAVGAGVEVGAGVAVGVGLGVAVGAGVAAGVGLGVAVGVSVGCGVAVGTGVSVGPGEGVGRGADAVFTSVVWRIPAAMVASMLAVGVGVGAWVGDSVAGGSVASDTHAKTANSRARAAMMARCLLSMGSMVARRNRKEDCKDLGTLTGWPEPVSAMMMAIRFEKISTLPLLNYTIKIPAEQTVAEIMSILVKKATTDILTHYSPGGMATGLKWRMETANGTMGFSLPINAEAVFEILTGAW